LLYTAQFRYSGPDRLDITANTSSVQGKVFAPGWDLVTPIIKARKRNADPAEMRELEKWYTDEYYNLLLNRWKFDHSAFHYVDTFCRHSDLTVVCYCPAGDFCHRHLLLEFMDWNWRTPIGGEREL
jgi:hypothetical protein